MGERICQVAGAKKVTMELGSNSPLIVLPDADMDYVAQSTTMTGYANAGQVCISTQRLIVHQDAHDSMMSALAPKIEAMTTGNQLEEAINVGPMVRESDAVRVESWINEAVGEGAILVVGGNRDRANLQPALLDNASPNMRICREELFGPAVAVMKARDINEAIQMANDTELSLIHISEPTRPY